MFIFKKSSKNFKIQTLFRGERSYTPQELLEIIQENSKASNYNWGISASELVRVCNLDDFPEECAIPIKVAILECFANVLNMGDYGAILDEDKEAIQNCYDTLGETERALETRRRYLTEIITRCTIQRFGLLHSLNRSTEYKTFCDNWIKSKVDELFPQPIDDLIEMEKNLTEEFGKSLEQAGIQRQKTFSEEDIARESRKEDIAHNINIAAAMEELYGDGIESQYGEI